MHDMKESCCGQECGNCEEVMGGGCCQDESGCDSDTGVAKVSFKAPKFEGEAYADGSIVKISSDDYSGKWTVLFFYPLDFTFVCPTEITGYSEAIDEFKSRNSVIIGCSTDSVHSHRAWCEGSLGKVKLPLLSDFTKKIADEYGVLLEDGAALRGTFIIDPQGILKYATIHDLNVGRSVEETLRVLDALQSGGLCGMGWKKGSKFVEKK